MSWHLFRCHVFPFFALFVVQISQLESSTCLRGRYEYIHCNFSRGLTMYADTDNNCSANACQDNSHWNEASQTCACNPGHVGNASIWCYPCPPGSVAVNKTCQQCAAGKFAPFYGTRTCEPCENNTFSSEDRTSCHSCPMNTEAPPASPNVTSCICRAGFTTHANYTVNAGLPCQPCAVGTFKTHAGNHLCDRCLSGTSAPSQHNVSCFQCTEAHYARPDQSACVPCPHASWSGNLSSDVSNCTCNAGYTGPNGQACSACDAGFYKLTRGSENCTKCPRGTFSSMANANNCSTCQAGTYTDGTSTCQDCPSDSTSPPDSTSVHDCECNAGYSLVEDNCTACAPGTYKEDVGDDANCTLCKPGFIGTDQGATSNQTCEQCSVNTYEEMRTTCHACEVNMSANAGSDNVEDCQCNQGYTKMDPAAFASFSEPSWFVDDDEVQFSVSDTFTNVNEWYSLDHYICDGFFEFISSADGGNKYFKGPVNGNQVKDNFDTIYNDYVQMTQNEKLWGIVLMQKIDNDWILKICKTRPVPMTEENNKQDYSNEDYDIYSSFQIKNSLWVFQNEQMPTCMACQAGKYKTSLGSHECTFCNESYVSAETGQTSEDACEQCPANEYESERRQCLACESFMSANAGSDNVEDCQCNQGYTKMDPAAFASFSEPSWWSLNDGVESSLSDIFTNVSEWYSLDDYICDGSYTTGNGYPYFRGWSSASSVSLQLRQIYENYETMSQDETLWGIVLMRQKNSDNYGIKICRTEPVPMTQDNNKQYYVWASGQHPDGHEELGNSMWFFQEEHAPTCMACQAGKYKTSLGSHECTSCNASYISTETGQNSSATCKQCPANQYESGRTQCVPCNRFMSASLGSSNVLDCQCNAGYTMAENEPFKQFSKPTWATESGDFPPTFKDASTDSWHRLDNYTCEVANFDSYMLSNDYFGIHWWRNMDYGARWEQAEGLYDANQHFGVVLYKSTYQTASNAHRFYMGICGQQPIPLTSDYMRSNHKNQDSLEVESSAWFGPQKYDIQIPSCKTCNEGTYKPSRGSEPCTLCPAGKKLESTSGVSPTNCTDCPADSYSSDNRASCTACPRDAKSQPGSHNISFCQCNAGYTVQANDHNSCFACEAGKYKNISGSAECTQCAAGLFSEAGENSTCGPCPANTYSSALDAGCVSCPENSQAKDNSKGIGDCMCNAGYTRNSSNGTRCVLCIQGKYKARPGNEACSLCERGTFSTETGADSNTTCLPCAAGSYSIDGRNTCTRCPTHANSSARSTSILDCICNKGFYGSNGTACRACEHGKYKDSNGPTECTLCEPGSAFQSDTGVAATSASSCVVCPLNTFSNETRANCVNCTVNSQSRNSSSHAETCLCNVGYTGNHTLGCTACAAGKYKNIPGPQKCVNCQAALQSATGQSTCGTCAQGKYVGPDQKRCFSCPNNSFSDVPDNDDIDDCFCNIGYQGANGTNCTACVAGKYKHVVGDANCTTCAPGKVSTSTSATTEGTCTVCPAGKYANEASTACVDCPTHSNSPVSASQVEQCVCNAGYTGQNGTLCEACSSGKYKHVLGDANCTICPVGKVSASTGAMTEDNCTVCPAGNYANEASTACVDCSANSFSPVGASKIQQCVCNAGYTGSDGGSCSPCAHGKYKQATGNETCMYCAPGRTTARMASNKTEDCVACEAGKYSHKAMDEQKCMECPENASSILGSEGNLSCICNIGHTGPNGTACAACHVGKYKSTTGPQACTFCRPGFRGTRVAGVSDTECEECKHGTYSISNRSFCQACPAHSNSSARSIARDNCTCHIGHEQITGGDCSPCLQGKYKNVSGNQECDECVDGGFSLAGASTCTSCAAGKYLEWDAKNCTNCPANSYSPGGGEKILDCLCNAGYGFNANETCTPCGYGTYKTELANANCTVCPVGSVLPNNGATANLCTSCPNATYTSENRSVCIPCFAHSTSRANSSGVESCKCKAGYYNEREGVCGVCAAGKYNSEQHATACTLCPSDTYSRNVVGSTTQDECLQCHDNSISGMGSVGKENCLCNAGFSENQESECSPCPRGTYKNESGNAACDICPANSYTDRENSAMHCDFCGAGATSLEKSVGSSSCNCAPGHGSSVNGCVQCTKGKYKSWTRNSQCSDCLPGHYMPDAGAEICTKCPEKQWADIGSDSLDDCTCMDLNLVGGFCESPVLRTFDAVIEISQPLFIEQELIFIKSLYAIISHPDDVFIRIQRTSSPARRLFAESLDSFHCSITCECTTEPICTQTIPEIQSYVGLNGTQNDSDVRARFIYSPALVPKQIGYSSSFGPEFDFPQQYPGERTLWQRFGPFVAMAVGIFSVCCICVAFVYFQMCYVFIPSESMASHGEYTQTGQDENAPNPAYQYYAVNPYSIPA